MIKDDSQFPIAPNISLPNFQFYEHETEKDFLSQKQSRYNLQKTIEAVKNDQILVNNLAEAVVIGQTRIPDFFWYSYAGIALETNVIVSFLLVVNCVYLLFKVRQIALLLFILKAKIHTVAAQNDRDILPLLFSYKTVTRSNDTDIVDGKGIHETILVLL